MGLGLLNMFVIDLLKIVALVGTGSGQRFYQTHRVSKLLGEKLPSEKGRSACINPGRGQSYACISESF